MKLKTIVLAVACSMAGTSTLPAQVMGTGSLLTNTSTTPGSATFTYNLTNPASSNVIVVGIYNDNSVTSPVVTFNGNAAVKSATDNRTTTACYFLPSPAPASVAITYTIAGTNATNTGLFVYELGGIDTSGGAASVDAGTAATIVTTGASKFVVDFTGINFGTGAGTVPAVGSIISGMNVGVLDINGGVGGGALAHGYGYSGAMGSQTLGWLYSNGSATGEVSLAFPTTADPDSDGDGLLDAWELGWDDITELTQLDGTIGSPSGSGDGSGDWDGDTHTDLAEFTAGSNPTDPVSVPGDIDGDGWSDDDEVAAFGNLNQLPDGDFDGDFSSNIDEINGGTLPANASSWPDIEPDGMADGWETAHGLQVGVDDSGDDEDVDDFSNLSEFLAGSDPQDPNWTPEHAILAHRWSFNGDLTDSVGGSDAQIQNDDAGSLGLSSVQNPESIELYGGAKATSDYILLGSHLLSNLQDGGVKPVTIELWATQQFVGNWSRIFAFGTDANGDPGANGSLRMTWSTGTEINDDQVAWSGNGTVAGTNAPYVETIPYHIVMTIVPAIYTNGILTQGATVTWYSAPASDSQAAGHPLYGGKGTFNSGSDLRALLDNVCYLGRSMWPDATASASYDEVRIWKGALTETERELFQLLGPENIDRTDADDDGFPDQWELARFGNTTTAAVGVDTDNDGDDDDLELIDESDPNDITSTTLDVDNDDLDDVWEMLFFNNLLQIGSEDYDGDFVSNEVEETEGTDPTDLNSSPDLDGDGISDGWELALFGDLTTADSTLRDGGVDTNQDGDFDIDLEEFQNGSDPLDEFSGRDVDGDQLPDFWEFTYFEPVLGVGSNPENPLWRSFNGSNDFDNDGADHASEFADQTDPADGNDFRDTNGDGLFDGILLVATDGFGQTSFNAGTNWANAVAPVAGKNYLVPFGLVLRTPDVATTSQTFAGSKLVIAGQLSLKGDNSTFNADYVFSDEFSIPRIAQIVNAGGLVTLGGNVEFQTASEIVAQNGPVAFLAPVSGAGALDLMGPAAIQFDSATNPYSGDITLGSTASLVVNGTLSPGAGSVYHIAPGATGVSNSIGGIGTINLAGTLDIDLSATTPTNGATWNIVSTSLVNYDAGFTVTGSGFTADAGVVGERIWTDASGDYQFDELTGMLSFIGTVVGYEGWAATSGLTPAVNDGAEDNPDSDGYPNLLEYQLNGDPLSFDEALVTTTEDETHLILTFERYDLSESDSVLTFQWSTDLGIWNDVIIGATGATDGDGVEVTVGEDLGASGSDYDAVTVRLPKSLNELGRLFGRLEGTQPEP